LNRELQRRLERLLGGTTSRAAERAAAEPTLVPGPYRDWNDWRQRRKSGRVIDPRGLGNPPLPASVEERVEDVSVITTRFDADFRHGPWNLREVRVRSTDWLDRLDGDRGRRLPFAWERSAFLDTETTSLSSGSGVWVFLTGIGCFEGPQFVVRQYLMHTPAAEQPYLEAIAADLAAHDRLVTFFGKAFDQHKLLDRARVQQMSLPLPADHFDLYWMARRLLHGRLADLKLKTLEREVLRYHRLEDLPGSEAPDAYFLYLREPERAGLDGVLLHNLIDIVSLPSLAAELSFRLESPAEAADRWARGFVLARNGEWGAAADELEERLAELAAGDALAAAQVFRRAGRFERQRQALERALATEADHAAALEELSKWWEHRGGDPAEALRLALRAIAVTRRPGKALEQRRLRLERRLAQR
jgi:hypothetical protein